jgi:2-hydroxychromene-2-carboxylate isomerase
VGDLLHFPNERARSGDDRGTSAPAFFFDVRCPSSYLAAERVERRLPQAEWVAVDAAALAPAPPAGAELARVHALARTLRLPLVWPDRFPVRAPSVQRAAAFACELGAGRAFALAAGRLAFCGGFSLEDPEVVAEAAAAAAVPLGACLEAAGETWRDDELREVSAVLRTAGIAQLPAVRIGSDWLQGEDALETAAAMLRGRLAQGPLAPVG